MKRIVGFIPEKKTPAVKKTDRKPTEKNAEKSSGQEDEGCGKSP